MDQQQKRHLSPDGKYYWDGTAWQPNNAPPPPPVKPFGPPQTPKKKMGKGKGCLTALGIVAALVVVLIIVAALQPNSKPTADQKPTPGHSAVAAATPKATPTSAPTSKPAAPKPTPKPKVVTFSVTGSAPDGVDIMYGSSTDNRQGGDATPWSANLPTDENTQYYSVSAQLNGDGDINCELTVDGVTQKGHASGGYNICHVEIVKGFLGEWDPAG